MQTSASSKMRGWAMRRVDESINPEAAGEKVELSFSNLSPLLHVK